MNDVNMYNVLAIGVVMTGLVFVTLICAATALIVSRERRQANDERNGK